VGAPREEIEAAMRRFMAHNKHTPADMQSVLKSVTEKTFCASAVL